VPCVVSDNRGGACAGVSYLLGLGHRRIALINGMHVAQSHLRLLGFIDALASQQVLPAEGYVRAGDWTWHSGYQQALALLKLPCPPTAIFCANDAMALGAMRALAEKSLRVPQDVSVLGFDDIQAAAQAVPGLTTLRQPAGEMIRIAIEMLVQAMEGEELVPCQRLLPTTLIIRSSCGPCTRKGGA
jgi:DNA-binding LacI/PurR family transcriptional regulator